MNKHQNGKIYKITNLDNNEVYIGSTIQTLPQRKAQHKTHKNTETKNFNWDNIKMELIKLYPCENEIELRMEEQTYQNEYECVNKIKAYRTPEEKIAYDKMNCAKSNAKTKALPKFEKNGKLYHNKYNANRSEKYVCECGANITKHSKHKHILTKKHLNHFLA